MLTNKVSDLRTKDEMNHSLELYFFILISKEMMMISVIINGVAKYKKNLKLFKTSLAIETTIHALSGNLVSIYKEKLIK